MRLTEAGEELATLPNSTAARRDLGCRSARQDSDGQDHLADVLIMGVAGLDMLRDGVHVAKTTLELVGPEHGGSAGHVIGGIDHRGRLMDGPGRGEAKRRPVLLVKLSGVSQIAPGLSGRGIEIGARRAQIAFGAADPALYGAILAHRLEADRRLAARA